MPYLSDSYRDYLASDAWKEKRRACIEAAGGRCQQCGKVGGILQAHHLTYERFEDECADDLLALCPDCHRFADWARKRGYPYPECASWDDVVSAYRDWLEDHDA